jgi:integrase
MSGRQAFPARDAKQLRRIIQAVDRGNPVIALMLEFMALTGLRYSDVSQLGFDDVMVNGVIRSTVIIIQCKIYSKSIAAGKSHNAARAVAKLTVHLNEQCRAVIEDLAHINHGKKMLFESATNPGKPYTCQMANILLKRAAAELKLDYQLSTHSFRKTFALALVKNGAAIHQVRDSLGQASLSSTDHYLRTFLSDTEALVGNIRF